MLALMNGNAPPDPQEQRGLLSALQAVRGLAALLVVWDHSLFTLGSKVGRAADVGFAGLLGDLGVAVFFVISGFVMVLSHKKDFAAAGAGKRFLGRRIGRIGPLYWLTAGIYAAKLALQGNGPTLRDIALSFAFIPHYSHGPFYGRPFYELGWTLQYEMFFYLAFAAVLLLRFKPGLALLAGSFLLFVLAGEAGGFGSLNPIAYLANPIVLLFVAGALIGALRHRLIASGRLPTWLTFGRALGLGLVLMAATIALGFPGERLTNAAIAVAIVSACGLCVERGPRSPLKMASTHLGDATYSIYLTHSFVLGPAGRIAGKAWPSIPTSAFVVLMLVAATIAGMIVYRVVERPLLRLWTGLMARGEATASPASRTGLTRSRPMRVGLYTKTWRASGTGLFAQELAHGITDAGGAVVLVAPRSQSDALEGPRAGLARIRPPRELTRGNRAARALVSLSRIAGAAFGLLRARLATRVFVVSIPDPLPAAVPMLALLRLSGARILYVVHDPLPHAWRLPRPLRPLEDGFYAAAYRLSNALVVLSESSRSALVGTYRLGSRPVEVIEHGVFVVGDPVPPPGDGTLLLFGTLRRNKGVREAIEGVIAARARGAKARLVIAGAPHAEDRDYWAACEGLARAHPDAVELRIGYVEDAALRSLIEGCDAFLMPYQEFFSQSGVAMLAGSNARPVIATLAGGIGDLIAEGMPAAAIAAPGGAADVADAVLAFARTPSAEWWRRALAYRRLTIDKRSWPAIGAHYLALAERLAGRSAMGGQASA